MHVITGIQGERLRGLGPGSDAASVKSAWTQTEEGVPTTALAPNPGQGLVRIDGSDQGRNNIYIGFENKGSSEAPLKVLAAGMQYDVTQLRDEEVIEDALFGKGIKRRVLTWGSTKNTNPNLPTTWDDHVQVITSADVRRITRR